MDFCLIPKLSPPSPHPNSGLNKVTSESYKLTKVNIVYYIGVLVSTHPLPFPPSPLAPKDKHRSLRFGYIRAEFNGGLRTKIMTHQKSELQKEHGAITRT